jgi:hypothetical protein
MAKVPKRTWTNREGEQTAWVADYFDQAGKRHIKTFERKLDAEAWLVTTRGEVARGTHTPESAPASPSPRRVSYGSRGVGSKDSKGRRSSNIASMSICTSCHPGSATRGSRGCRRRRSKLFEMTSCARGRERWRARC